MPFGALILDFDGLIRDTETPRLLAWQETFRAQGQELDLALYRQVLGTRGITLDLLGVLEQLLGHAVDRETVDRQRIARREALLALEAVRPGVSAHVQEARASGMRTGIATSSSRESVVAQLRELRLGGCWDGMCCGDEVTRSKPDPEIYLAAAQRLGVAPAETIAYEDSPNGILAAKRAGLACVAIPNSVTRDLDLSAADLIVESLADIALAEVIARLGSRQGSTRKAGVTSPPGARRYEDPTE